jgi:hypothetical protein
MHVVQTATNAQMLQPAQPATILLASGFQTEIKFASLLNPKDVPLAVNHNNFAHLAQEAILPTEPSVHHAETTAAPVPDHQHVQTALLDTTQFWEHVSKTISPTAQHA